MAQRNATTGELTWDAGRFPSGLPTLISWLHSQGLKFGLYTSAGNQTCSSGGRPYKVPGSRGHYDQDAKTFAGWGVDYVKVRGAAPRPHRAALCQCRALGQHAAAATTRALSSPSRAWSAAL